MDALGSLHLTLTVFFQKPVSGGWCELWCQQPQQSIAILYELHVSDETNTQAGPEVKCLFNVSLPMHCFVSVLMAFPKPGSRQFTEPLQIFDHLLSKIPTHFPVFGSFSAYSILPTNSLLLSYILEKAEHFLVNDGVSRFTRGVWGSKLGLKKLVAHLEMLFE